MSAKDHAAGVLSGRSAAVLALAWLAAAAPSIAAAPGASRCIDIEAPAALGRPHVLVPAGLVSHTSPSSVLALARGAREDAVVTCMELQPGDPTAGPGGIQAEPTWAVHVEVPFFRIVSGARGSCKAPHTMVFVADESGLVVSTVGIGQKCSMQPYRFVPGR